jgi:hypothetical protein
VYDKNGDYLALNQILEEILKEISTVSCCQSVGIRLHDNGDYPYYVYEGFPNFFIIKEKRLCVEDGSGNKILDEQGNPLLECMCGNVIKGRFDPKLPYFTKKGSFWTNSTTKFLQSVTEEEKKLLGHTRNMCYHSGYESVALIPLQVGKKTLGLIQMNDPREDMFTSEAMERYECLADCVGEVVHSILNIQEKMTDISDLVKKFKTSEESPCPVSY